MLDTIGKITLVLDFIEWLKRVAQWVIGLESSPKKQKAAKAIRAILEASSATRAFIGNAGYIRSPEIEKKWLDAMELVVEADIGEALPKYLIYKAKFWGQPEEWIYNPASLELVPKLAEIEERCDALLRLLK